MSDKSYKDLNDLVTASVVGEPGAAVDRVYQYLARYGYLGVDHGVPTPPALADLTPDALAAGIRAVHDFHRIVPREQRSGTIDAPLLDLIARPRCGRPDLEELPPGCPGELKGTTFRYGFKNTDAIGLDADKVKNLLREAFNSWTGSIPLNFVDGSDASIEIQFTKDGFGDVANPFVEDKTLGTGEYPCSRKPQQLKFNGYVNWSLPQWFFGASLRAVALHEIGHVLGLTHSDNKNSIMYAYNQDLEQLQNEDIVRIVAIYQKRGGLPTPAWMNVLYQELALQNPTNYYDHDAGPVFRGVNRLCMRSDYVGGYANFEAQNSNCGVIVLGPEAAEWRNVTAGDLNLAHTANYYDRDVGPPMRGAGRYASARGFRGAYPTFEAQGDLNGIVMIRPDAAVHHDLTPAQLGLGGNTDGYSGNAGPAFRGAHRWAVANGYLGGFPNFESSGNLNGVICIRNRT